MRARTRIRIFQTVKWAGTCFSLLVLAAWAFVSPLLGDNLLYLTRHTRTSDWELSLESGVLKIVRWDREVSEYEGGTFTWNSGLKMEEGLRAFGIRMPFYGYDSNKLFTYQALDIPLWLIFALAMIPNSLLWYRGRRRFPAGHCGSCGYDLIGNLSGVCPECGTPCQTEAKTED